MEGSAYIARRRSAFSTQLLCATALACAGLVGNAILPAAAQEFGGALEQSTPGAEMLLEADTLVYDRDANTVTAVGGVQIEYDGNRLVAQRLIYDRATSRLVARGDVQIVYKDGTKIFSDEFDVTDDFADGFANALRVETIDKTYFAAESAERKAGILTTFNNGVYTACEPCEDDPGRPPIWRVKARKIIWNGKADTIRFERPRFELFGFPIAALPAFEIAGPSKKRKSGFLIPGINYSKEKGVAVTVPYYWAISPTYDITFSPRYYSKQGFMGEVEWRQAFNSGQYTLKIAGIRQNEPEAFRASSGRYTEDSGPLGEPNRDRFMVGTKGDFTINPRWRFGWDLLWQSDKNFSSTYDISGFDASIHKSQIYLTGLNDRNYFDLRGIHYDIQEDLLDSHPSARQDKQPLVLPSFDYSFTPDDPVAGGELNIDVNARVISRDKMDALFARAFPSDANVSRIRGLEGDSGRLTAEAEWKRSVVTDGGLVVTPLLAFQSDANYVNYDANSRAAVEAMAGYLNLSPNYTGAPVESEARSSFYRYMATAGLEMRWPVLFSATSSTHVLEPTAQIFARPNSPYSDELGLPNEDAQSFVFDASTLFERDKFSGYDRIEGGTRANVGFRYVGTYDNGWTTNAMFGQSYQIAGDNPFASPDLVNAGAYSGLETDTSDFVGLVGFESPIGLSASVAARFDERTFEVRRTDLRAALTRESYSLSARYAYIQEQPLYGTIARDQNDLTLGAAVNFNENWRLFGRVTYDFEASKVVEDSIGFSYADECFTYLMTVKEERHRITDEVSRSIGFNLSFRTIGDFGSSSDNVSSAF